MMATGIVSNSKPLRGPFSSSGESPGYQADREFNSYDVKLQPVSLDISICDIIDSPTGRKKTYTQLTATASSVIQVRRIFTASALR